MEIDRLASCSREDHTAFYHIEVLGPRLVLAHPSSRHPQEWSLGGQRGIRSIWHRYYDECHAVAYVIDASDKDRLDDGWEVFGSPLPTYSSLLLIH